ncbi:MAG: ABC transporter permease [Armatimonadetes bacterium]|nr:ABC transporter permease [Armatimonadota bacterium]
MALFLRALSAAMRSLVEQRQRALLSALGITVGSLAIVLLMSIAAGVKDDVGREIGEFGVDLLFVLPGHFEEDTMVNPGLLGISYLEEQDVKRIRGVDGVRHASALCFVGGGIRVGSTTSPTSLVVATEPDWFVIRNPLFLEGGPLTPGDERANVCVLGEIVKKKLFGDFPALGKTVVYNGEPYRVVGVTRKKFEGTSLISMGGFENFMYVPFQLIREKQPEAQVNRILIQSTAGEEPKALVKRIEGCLAERLERDKFTVFTQDELQKFAFSLMGILSWLLVGLTSIALVVGGVGIMTVMLMSVNERTKEIGIRKAFGAKRRDVFLQFLLESLMLSVSGGTLGLALSWAACEALRAWTPLKPLITLGTVSLALGTCILVGSVFGLLPAVRAARKDPVQSLRYE